VEEVAEFLYHRVSHADACVAHLNSRVCGVRLFVCVEAFVCRCVNAFHRRDDKMNAHALEAAHLHLVAALAVRVRNSLSVERRSAVLLVVFAGDNDCHDRRIDRLASRRQRVDRVDGVIGELLHRLEQAVVAEACAT
jgi:hypothetical protein